MNIQRPFLRLVRLGAALFSISLTAMHPFAAPPENSAEPAPAAPSAAKSSASANAAVSPGDLQLDREINQLTERANARQTDPALWIRLGDALMQKGRLAPDAAVLHRAETSYEKALRLDAKSADALLGLAWVHSVEHEFGAARKWAEKALAIDPGLAAAHALIGDGEVELGDYDAAFASYQQALDLRPDLSTYSRSAHLLWLTGDDRKARWLMQKAIDAGGPHAENTAWCRAQLALMLWHNGALLPAAQQIEQALQAAPRHTQVLIAAARIRAAQEERASAIELLERAVSIAPEHDSLVLLGDLYTLAGRPNDAAQTYDRLLSMHRAGAAHSHGGHVHSHPSDQGNAQLARFLADHDRDLEEAVREAELAHRTFKNVFVADTLAWCYYKAGRLQEAKKTIRQALRWKTPDASILFHAGMIHAKLGEHAAARQFLNRALSLNPRFHPRDAAAAAEALRTGLEIARGPEARDSAASQGGEAGASR